MGFAIAEVKQGAGLLGICALPGRGGDYATDLARVLAWQPDLVLSMTETHEMQAMGAGNLGADLIAAGIVWRHLPIADFGAPSPDVLKLWPEISAQVHRILANGGRVLAHCMGGCGRSGTILLRLMVEAGETPVAALARLRKARPCAVETPGQMEWASQL